MQRQRYNYWMALGDIGGFHDGMSLLIGLFMGPYSALVFLQNFVQGGVYSAATQKQKQERKQAVSLLQESQVLSNSLINQTVLP